MIQTTFVGANPFQTPAYLKALIPHYCTPEEAPVGTIEKKITKVQELKAAYTEKILDFLHANPESAACEISALARIPDIYTKLKRMHQRGEIISISLMSEKLKREVQHYSVAK
jgi:hypothetical protein